MVPLAQAYNDDGSIRTSAWEDSSEAFAVNPLSEMNNRTKDVRMKLITNNALTITFPFVKGLRFKFNTGYTYANSSWKQYQGMDTYYGARSNGILNTDDRHTEEWLIENIDTISTTQGGRTIQAMYIGRDKPLRMWIQGGLHGNEPAGVEVAFLTANRLLSTSEGREILNKVQFAIVPIANPDGYDARKREALSGLDLNRDMTKMTDSMTVILKQAFLNYAPNIVLDVHEYKPKRKEYKSEDGHALAVDYDLLYLPSSNPNIPTSLRTIVDDLLIPQSTLRLEEMDYTSAIYFAPHIIDNRLSLSLAGRSPQSSSTWNALNGAVSLFLEIRGIGYGSNNMKKRIGCGFAATWNFLQTIAKNDTTVLDSIKIANNYAAHSQDSICVAFESSQRPCKVNFTDLKTFENICKDLPTLDAMQPKIVIKRARPAGYIIPDTCVNLIRCLKNSGIKLTTVMTETKAIVEEYIVENQNKSETKWEGIYRNSVGVRTEKRCVNIPKGYLITYANAPNAPLLMSLMEPESQCGFVDFNVVSTNKENKLPYMRLFMLC